MATTLLGVLPGSRQGEWRAGDLVLNVYRRTYLIKSDAPGVDDEITVLNTAGLPKLNTLYQGETNQSTSAICKFLRCTDRNGARTRWLVEAEFSNDTDSTDDNEDSGESGEDPTDLDPDFEFGVIKEQYVAQTVSQNVNTLIRNGAGEAYTDPPPLHTRQIYWWRMSRWRLNFDVNSLLAVDCTNDRLWRGARINHAKVADIAANTQSLFNTKLWRVRYLVQFRVPKNSRVPAAPGEFRAGWWFPQGGLEGWCVPLDNVGTIYWPNGFQVGESIAFESEPPHKVRGPLTATGAKAVDPATNYPVYYDPHRRIDMESLIFGGDVAPSPTPAVSDPAPT